MVHINRARLYSRPSVALFLTSNMFDERGSAIYDGYTNDFASASDRCPASVAA